MSDSVRGSPAGERRAHLRYDESPLPARLSSPLSRRLRPPAQPRTASQVRLSLGRNLEHRRRLARLRQYVSAGVESTRLVRSFIVYRYEHLLLFTIENSHLQRCMYVHMCVRVLIRCFCVCYQTDKNGIFANEWCRPNVRFSPSQTFFIFTVLRIYCKWQHIADSINIIILLPAYRNYDMFVKLVCLLSISAYFKGQGCLHVDCEYLVNVDI